MGFNELIGALREPPEEGNPASIYDDLSHEYAAISEGANAKVTGLESALMDKESEISRLKSVNYDLLMSSAASSDDTDNSDNSDNDAPSGIDSLFAH